MKTPIRSSLLIAMSVFTLASCGGGSSTTSASGPFTGTWSGTFGLAAFPITITLSQTGSTVVGVASITNGGRRRERIAQRHGQWEYSDRDLRRVADESDQREGANTAEGGGGARGLPLFAVQPKQKRQEQDERDLDAFRRERAVEVAQHGRSVMLCRPGR